LPFPQLPIYDENLVIRTAGDPTSVIGGVRAALRSLDPGLPLANIRTLDDRVWASTGPVRFRTGLMALFGVLGLLLAAIGIYGVIAFSVAQRTRELGVRMALGASGADVMRMVVGETARLAAVGAAIGIALSLATGRLIASILFAVSPTDVVALIGTTAAIIIVALTAGFLPAWRAAATDPMAALR